MHHPPLINWLRPQRLSAKPSQLLNPLEIMVAAESEAEMEIAIEGVVAAEIAAVAVAVVVGVGVAAEIATVVVAAMVVMIARRLMIAVVGIPVQAIDVANN